MVFAAKSAYNLRLTHLLRVVVLIAQCMLPYAHVQTFGQNVLNLFLTCQPRLDSLCIPMKNFRTMLSDLRDKMDKFHMQSGIACLFTPDEDADMIFEALDGDGDGLLTEIEFCMWVFRGISISYFERHKFANSSLENMRILNLFEVICILCNGAHLLDGMLLATQTARAKDNALAHGLKTLFDQFDVDKSGAIDREELQKLMIDLPGRFFVSPTDMCLPGDVDLVMRTLDTDGSGTVDFDEWKDWVLNGVKKSKTSRASFAEQSPSHYRLDRFMDTIMHISHECSAPLIYDEVHAIPGLTSLFEEYNVSHTGMMTPRELKKMISDLKLRYQEVEWFEVNNSTAAAIVLAVGDSSLKISLHNWIEWMTRGARRSALKRAKFSAASSQFKILNAFLEGVLQVIKIRNLKALSATSRVPEYRRGHGRHTSGYAGRIGKVL